MEPGAVQEAAEDVRDLLLHDPGPVVLRDDEELVLPRLLNLDADVREDARVLASVEGVLAELLDDRQEGLRGGVVPEDLFVPLEELRDGNLPLLLRELLGDGQGGQAIPSLVPR